MREGTANPSYLKKSRTPSGRGWESSMVGAKMAGLIQISFCVMWSV